MLDDESADALLEQTSGNPLFTRELLIATDRGNELQLAAGRYRYRSPKLISDRLADLLLAHRQGLQPEDCRALDTLACASVPVPVALLTQMFGDAVERLEIAGAVVIDRTTAPNVVELSHPLVGEYTLARLTEPERADLLGELTAVAASDDLGADAITVALWQLGSGRAGGGGRLLQGAQAALARFDGSLVIRLASAAADAGAGFDAQLLVARGRAMIDPESDEELEAILAAALTRQDSDEISAAGQALARHLMFERQRIDDALDVLSLAIGALSDRHHREALIAERAMIWIFSRDIRSVIPDLEPIVADSKSHPATRIHAHVALSIAYSFSGQSKRAIENGRQWQQLRRTVGVADVRIPFMPATAAAVAHMHAGRPDEMHRILDGAQQELLAAGEVEHATLVDQNRAAGFLVCGHIAEGLRYAESCVEVNRKWDPFRLLAFSLSLLAFAQSVLGRPKEARLVLDEVAALPEPYVRPALVQYRWAEAWYEVSIGARSRAVALLLDGAAAGERMGQMVYVANLLHDAVRLGAVTEGIRLRLATASRDFDGDLIAAIHLEHAEAVADGDVDRLIALAGRYERRWSILDAADSWGEVARIQDKRANAALAMKARAEADRLLQQAGVASTPATRLPVSTLTPRESEVASLAASGLSNREIADRLGTAKRTVDNQLSSVYRKLGVAGRDGLPRL